MSSITLTSSIEQMSLYTTADNHHLPKPKPFLTPGVEVTSHLRKLYQPKAEWALMESFIKPEFTARTLQQPTEFDRRYQEVRKLFKRMVAESPDVLQLVSKADAILEKNQKNLKCLNTYRSALIGA